ncbi:MAG: DUF2339 domain-containing protein [Sulfurovum sp.]|nr:DUF2339 domain-containing protein [Sulfurovum sp.]
MNISALFFIILVYWIFLLQSKIKHLEKLVYNLKDKKPYEETVKTQNVSISEKTVVANETDTVDDHTVTLAIENTPNNVERFKQVYNDTTPQEPSQLASFITNYFTGGNLLVRIGGVILFFGLAFLVKYAAEHSVISIQVRLVGIAIIAIILVIVGWKLRDREGAYGQILQGLGIAMFYLVIYAASKFYALLSLDIAFALMLLVVIIGSVLSVMEDALPLALFATAGGFLVPILTSSGDGSHIILFSYYVLLNLSIFIVAWYRSWRVLNVVGFLFTFVISGTWGVLRYRSDFFSTTEPFLILYFLMYLTISILFTVKHTFKPRNFVDGTLVFGLPLVAFPLQINLVQIYEYGEAYSAMVLGTFYMILWFWLNKKERTQLLSKAFLALGVVFYTIAIPYVFDADVSAALWSLESAAIIWIALKQERAYARYFGELLLLISIVIYPIDVHIYGITMTEYLGYIIITVASLIASYLLDKHRKQLSMLDMYIPKILLGFALILWIASTTEQWLKFEMLYINAMLFSLSLGALILFIVTKVLNWKLLILTLQGYFALGIILFFMQTSDTLHFLHPFEGFGTMALSIFVLLNYLFLCQYDKAWRFTKQIHVLTLWFITIVFMLELHYHAELLQMGKSLSMIAIAIVPLLLTMMLLVPKRYTGWLETYRRSYQLIAAGGLVEVLILWELRTFGITPDFKFSYIPLFNPLDITQALGLAIIAYWIYSNKESFIQSTKVFLYGVVAFMSTILVSVIFARFVHVFREVDYTLIALWKNIYYQTGISILWSVIAIVLMLLSKRYKNRPLWLAGFGLLILVVLKLFFVELASSGTIERIISFLVVGSLLLLIGYFVPLPPGKDEK